MSNPSAEAKLVIISGPSGAGKSTLIRRVIEQCAAPLKLSVSATTRAPRRGEVDGRDYHFLTPEEFQLRRSREEFLECKEVFGQGDWYGTLRSDVEQGQATGHCMVLEIDVEGAQSVIQQMAEAITIFVHPGSIEELERRLRARGTDSEQAIQRRLKVARREMELGQNYQHQIINPPDNMDQAVQAVCRILV